ncbi:MAG: hypothetical protein A3C54_04375 [Deltaproteobacteria bacterium RIFCSPHIGHO2_02_FULL_60_17]|nr:MAG: hypothetical protein A3C54_04375 [Deltaproteobacteria bacterium RIFCSPHIGHO2_02_FULL_60_17]OGQ74885.1 MAG: hypothetical protein A3G94_08245 [Deltaproteobacteria bacterium RIFCSPLOWO2_12_FULL_60_16]
MLKRGCLLVVFFIGSLVLLPLTGGAPISAAEKEAEKKRDVESKESFNLILPFRDVTVGQGQEVTMDTEVVNRTKNPVRVSLAIEGVPEGWEVGFNSRYPSYPVRSVMVQGEKSTTIEFKAKVSDKTKPGNYEVKVSAKDEIGKTAYGDKILFRITSKKVETGGLKLTSQYPVLTTPSGQTLKFTVDLKNETNKPLTASLISQAPTGWAIRFKPQFGDTQISSIQLKENATETLSVEIDSPLQAKAGEHPVTVRARAGAFEASTNLKVTLRGVTDLKMGTTGGTLNASVTAGQKTPVPFVVVNSGTAPVRNLAFVTKKPDKWTIDFKPDKIDSLNSGELREISMEITAPARAIAGDYEITILANSQDTNKSLAFRVTVATATLWGWIGALIVAAVVLGLGVVFVRLGRR